MPDVIDKPTVPQTAQKEYARRLKADMAVCPKCQSDRVVEGEFVGDEEKEDKVVVCRVECKNCNLAWTEEYRLSKVTEFTHT